MDELIHTALRVLLCLTILNIFISALFTFRILESQTEITLS